MKGDIRSAHTERKGHMKTQQGRWLSASQGERIHQKPALLTPWSWTFSLQNSEKINSCSLCHPFCSILQSTGLKPFTVFLPTFKSMIHFVLVFVYGREEVQFHSFACGYSVFLASFFSHWTILASLSKINWPCVASGLSVLFCYSMCLSLCQYHNIWK